MRMANEQGKRVYYNSVEKHGKLRFVVKAIGGHKLRGRDKQLTSSRTFRTQDKAEAWLHRNGYRAD